MLVLPIVIMKPSNMKKQIKELLNVTKVKSHVIQILPNVTMELLNVRKEIKIPSNVKKSKVKCDVSTA